MDIPIVFAFSAGIVAAFNPCGIAMFPAYVGYQLGSSQGLPNPVSSNPLRLLAKGLFLGVLVTAGFIVVFGTVGFVLAFGGRFIRPILPVAGLFVGLIISILGLWLLWTGHVMKLPSLARLSFGRIGGAWQTFLFGVAYAIASLSCALPIFLAAIGIIVGSGVSVGGTLNIAVGTLAYSLGMGAIMTGVTVVALFFEDATTRLVSRLLPWVDRVGKIAMVFAGAYITYYWSVGKGKELLLLRLEQLFS